jgi:hypothetical protein
MPRSIPAAAEPASQVGTERLDSIVEVRSELFFEVPLDKYSEATNIIGDKQIVQLDAKQVVALFGKQPDIVDKIEKISQKYSALAKFEAAGAANPSLKEFAEKLLAKSREYSEYAEYYQRLKKRVRPFLVMGMGVRRQNAVFSGIKRGSALMVMQTYLGCCDNGPTFSVPLIVYLTDKPEDVEISAHGIK